MLALLIDGLNFVRRIDAAVPGDDDPHEHADGVLRSVARSLVRALNENAPSHALAAFDAPGPSWRHALHADYKAGRPAMPDALQALLPRIGQLFAEHGVRTVRVPGYEADDVLASVASRIAARGGDALILSTDKSMLSLLDEHVRVRNHFDGRDLDARYVRDRFGVAPGELTAYLALVGESSQDVPGVRSIGAKTARRLIAEHGSLAAILAAADDMRGRIGDALRAGADDARLSLALVTLRRDVEIGLNLSQCRLPDAGAPR